MRVGYRKAPESSGMEGYVVGATCEGICGRCVVGHGDGDGDGNRGMEGMADGIITKSGDEAMKGVPAWCPHTRLVVRQRYRWG